MTGHKDLGGHTQGRAASGKTHIRTRNWRQALVPSRYKLACAVATRPRARPAAALSWLRPTNGSVCRSGPTQEARGSRAVTIARPQMHAPSGAEGTAEVAPSTVASPRSLRDPARSFACTQCATDGNPFACERSAQRTVSAAAGVRYDRARYRSRFSDSCNIELSWPRELRRCEWLPCRARRTCRPLRTLLPSENFARSDDPRG